MQVNAVAFDHSGSYVAIGGSDVRCVPVPGEARVTACCTHAGGKPVDHRAYIVKQWDELLRLEEHGKAVSGVGWNATATTLYSAGADNTVITYA